MAQHRHAQAPLSQPTREHRATTDFTQPVRTAVMAMTGSDALNIVRLGPSSAKSAPAASEREARCITCACPTSL